MNVKENMEKREESKDEEDSKVSCNGRIARKLLFAFARAGQ